MPPGEPTRRNRRSNDSRPNSWGSIDRDLPDDDDGRALFRKLRDDDFLPDPVSHEALLALAGRPVSHESQIRQEAADLQERRLHAAVERFAAEFFSIPVADRVERWKVLAETCSRQERLIERLWLLKPGLTLDPTRTVEASPVVKRLIDDILALFPMRFAPRAAEARARVERFRTDIGDATERSKALKELRKRHPEVVAVADGYLDRFSGPGRPFRLRDVGDSPNEHRSVVTIPANAREPGKIRAFVTIAVVVIATVSRLATSGARHQPSPPPPTSSFSRPIPRPPVPTALTTAPNLIVRDELKLKIRAELSQLGKEIDDSQLDRLVAGLPVEVVPNVGGMGTVRLLGAWTEKIQARFVLALKQGLLETDLDLTESEVDDVVARALPATSSAPVPTRPSSP